ncbi:MAG: hypothetical protein IJ225_02860 [Solobacterium sp.]|nr:hypothetical protein [Solobacterium sp.]
MINPWKRTASLDEAMLYAGIPFPIIPPGMFPEGIQSVEYFCMDRLIECSGKGSGGSLAIRKTTRLAEHLSGDYNAYPASYDYELRGTLIHCRGTEDRINTAELSPLGCQVSVVMNPGRPGSGLTPEDLAGLLQYFIE